MVEGINIPSKVAEEQFVPADLNSLAVGNYTVPIPSKRKIYPYLSLIVLLLFYFFSLSYKFINFIPVFLILIFLTIFLFAINNDFYIDQKIIIETILDKIDFAVGYYSIALTFQFKLTSLLKPVWTVIVYSSENPPKKRTIIEIDALSGETIDKLYTENLDA